MLIVYKVFTNFLIKRLQIIPKKVLARDFTTYLQLSLGWRNVKYCFFCLFRFQSYTSIQILLSVVSKLTCVENFNKINMSCQRYLVKKHKNVKTISSANFLKLLKFLPPFFFPPSRKWNFGISLVWVS